MVSEAQARYINAIMAYSKASHLSSPSSAHSAAHLHIIILWHSLPRSEIWQKKPEAALILRRHVYKNQDVR